jgi:hypothetical protein
MIVHSRRRAIFLIILLIFVAAAITGFVIRQAAKPIVYEVQREIDDSVKPSKGTAKRAERKSDLPTEPMEGVQR